MIRFRPGDLVTCIHVGPNPAGEVPSQLKLNHDYFVTFADTDVIEGAYGIRVAGAQAHSPSGMFRHDRFVRANKLADEISIGQRVREYV